MGRFLQHLDIKITFLLLAIGVFGLGIILTINTTLFFQQLLFFILGIILLVMCSSLDKSLLYFFSPVFYVIGTLFLSLSYLGPNIRGATRWIMIGNTQLQPSELVKPLILLGLSYCMAKYVPSCHPFPCSVFTHFQTAGFRKFHCIRNHVGGNAHCRRIADSCIFCEHC